ncbi:MAG: glycosyltransferase family 4 protein [Alphaproteobacteria bacterium]
MILQIIPELGAGGAEPIVIDLASAIVQAGGSALVASHGGFRVREVLARGARHIDLPVHTKNPYGMLANTLRLTQLIDMYGVDLVHVHSRAPAWSALVACHATDRPLVATYHGTYNAKGAWKRFYNSGMVRSEAVIACSRFIAAHVEAQHGLSQRGIDVIPCGIDMDSFHPDAVDLQRVADLRLRWGVDGQAGPPNTARGETPGKMRIVLLPARLTAWKGHRVLIEALARVKAAGRHVDNWTAVLVGDPQGRQGYVDALEQRIRRLNLRGRVLIHGHEDNMPAAYAAADIVVSPAVEPEAFGRVPVEAQAMGRPVIATNHGGPTETVRAEDAVTATGWLVPPRNPKALGEAIETALDLDLEDWRAMGARGREHVERTYALDTMTGDTLALYRRLIEDFALPIPLHDRTVPVPADPQSAAAPSLKESVTP